MSTRLAPALALVLLALTAACGSSDKVTGPGSNASCSVKLAHGSMSAKIDGATWCANVGLNTSYNSKILAIGATDNTGQTLGIGVAVLNGPGTYAIGPLSATNATLYSTSGGGWSATLAQGSGSVTINSISATGASGTFAFSMTPANAGSAGTKNITNGVFNVTF
jgi:hypothetical protein